ncbi:putative aldouronate transport system permease protein [Paenibacillus sp. UNCCL117]|uniref:ABC transporter permease n=1 Tax=unclassified Paenibacillus TaxID=185978 RepID=UPI0008865260|nr:carbohydrate ABC transporter membrane protein 1, CUT1 family [Paenibacillus sp. cl123]SFW32255.1 putative aldouronate transport system permease protein [Paenibacillus sp. UNCCL117]
MKRLTLRQKEEETLTRLERLYKNGALLVMTVPGLLLLLAFHYLPIGGILIAFKDYSYSGGDFFSNFTNSPWVGFDNFAFFLNTPDAFIITRNTILYNLVFIGLGTLIAVFLAVAFNELRSRRMAKIYQTTILLPYFLSWIAVSYLFFGFLSADKGIINHLVLEPLGIGAVDWYSQSAYWPYILVFANVWKYAGYNCIVYLAAITGIDTEYYEAASLDGASKWQQIRHITIPSISTVITLLVLLGIGRMFFADFGLFYQVPLNSGAIFDVTNVIDTFVYRALINSGDIGMSSAASTFQAFVGFVLVLLSNWVVKRIDNEKAIF